MTNSLRGVGKVVAGMTLALTACKVAHAVASRNRTCTESSNTVGAVNLNPILLGETYAIAWPTFTVSLSCTVMEKSLSPAVQAIVLRPDGDVNDVTGFDDAD